VLKTAPIGNMMNILHWQMSTLTGKVKGKYNIQNETSQQNKVNTRQSHCSLDIKGVVINVMIQWNDLRLEFLSPGSRQK
jgi:hypothetical protein